MMNLTNSYGWDAQYLSYDGANTNYETVDGHGDAHEFSVCGFLWDLRAFLMLKIV